MWGRIKMNDDLISRKGAVNALWDALYEYEDKTEKQFQEASDLDVGDWILHREFVQNMNDIDRDVILKLPSVQPFHNITMNDVLKYIDGMPEDVWQEFIACLECRGWELQRRTAKWCGSEFA